MNQYRRHATNEQGADQAERRPGDRRELPTHLHVEDKLIAGLTVRQVLILSVGLSLGYSLWLRLAGLPAWLPHLLSQPSQGLIVHLATGLRFLFGALPVVLAAACALFRPADRPLEDWAFIALRYLSLPKAAVWRPLPPSSGHRGSEWYAPDDEGIEDDIDDAGDDDADTDPDTDAAGAGSAQPVTVLQHAMARPAGETTGVAVRANAGRPDTDSVHRGLNVAALNTRGGA
jgi:hypothetical protein